MLDPRLRYESKVLLDYTSAAGSQVTHVKGHLITGSLAVIAELGRGEELARAVLREHRSAVSEALASAWLPIGPAAAFYDACDNTLSSEESARVGTLMGTRLGEGVFATLLRSLRGAATDTAMSFALGHGARMWDRMYQGGGLLITRLGPKDTHFESRGIPYAQSRFFRGAHVGFLQGLVDTVARRALVRLARPTVATSDRLAVTISWV